MCHFLFGAHVQSVVLCVCASCDKKLIYPAKKYPDQSLHSLD